MSDRTIVAVTHDSELTSLIADHLVVIRAGRVLAQGDFDAVKALGDPDVNEILTRVLGEIMSYDSDLLSILEQRES